MIKSDRSWFDLREFSLLADRCMQSDFFCPDCCLLIFTRVTSNVKFCLSALSWQSCYQHGRHIFENIWYLALCLICLSFSCLFGLLKWIVAAQSAYLGQHCQHHPNKQLDFSLLCCGNANIHQFLLILFGIGSWWQQAKRGGSDVPLPSRSCGVPNGIRSCGININPPASSEATTCKSNTFAGSFQVLSDLSTLMRGWDTQRWSVAV